MAADHILDRSYGKPPQFSTTDAGQFRRACDLTDDELVAIIVPHPLKYARSCRPIPPRKYSEARP